MTCEGSTSSVAAEDTLWSSRTTVRVIGR